MYSGKNPATSPRPVLAISFSPSELMPQRSSQIGRLKASG